MRTLVHGAAAALLPDPLGLTNAVRAQVPAARPGVPGFSTARLDQKVAEFQALFGSNVAMYRRGQFYLTEIEYNRLWGVLQTTMDGNPLWALLPDPARAKDQVAQVFNDILKDPFRLPKPDDAERLLKSFPGAGPWTLVLQEMFKSSGSQTSEDWAKKWYTECWRGSAIPTSQPWIPDAPSVEHYRAAAAYEKDRCYQTVTSMVHKLCARHGVKSVPLDLAYNGTLTAQTKFFPPTVDRSARVRTDQSVIYDPPGALTASVERLKTAIDRKVGVICGLLSGTAYDHSPFPQPEHHIVLLAHDSIDGADAFLFWDPDGLSSNILGPPNSGTGWGSAFGVLFAAEGRLSTAKNSADFFDNERDSSASNFGLHRTQGVRHRYQVWTFETRV